MAGSWSDYWETAILDYTLRGVAIPTLPGSLYYGLMKVMPSEANAGGTEVSTSGTGYARVAVTRSTGTYDALTDDTGSKKTANTNAITFANPSGDWGTVVGVGIFDASTSGNLIGMADLGTNRTILNGDNAPSFAAGSVTFKQS